MTTNPDLTTALGGDGGIVAELCAVHPRIESSALLTHAHVDVLTVTPVAVAA